MARRVRTAGLAACLLAILAMTCDSAPGDGSSPSAAPEANTAVPIDLDALLEDDNALLANWASVFEEINRTLDGVSDADSARAAAPHLDALADGPLARLRELREDGAFRPDSGETAVAWLREHNRFVGNVVRLSSNAAVQPVLEQPLERLMRFFEPTT